MTFARKMRRKAKAEEDVIRVTKGGRVYLVPRNALAAMHVAKIDRGYGPDLVLSGAIKDAGMVH